jgi:hypothetical protein
MLLGSVVIDVEFDREDYSSILTTVIGREWTIFHTVKVNIIG